MSAEEFPSCIAAARRGDPKALEVLCERYYPAVQRMAHAALRARNGGADPHLVALFSTGDIVQDVFRSVLRNLGSFTGESEGEFVNYLVVSVRTRLVDMLRFHMAVRRDRRRTEPVGESAADFLDERCPDELLSLEEQVQIYYAVLEGTPARQRILLVRRLGGEASFQDLADELDFPSADAARKAYAKAHARLLVELRRRGVQSWGESA